jgi:hypothetical protein
VEIFELSCINYLGQKYSKLYPYTVSKRRYSKLKSLLQINSVAQLCTYTLFQLAFQ